MEARYLFPFSVWAVWLISVLLKIHSLVIPSHSSFSISLCLSPSVALIFSMVALYLCVSSLHVIGMGCDSLSLSLFVQFSSPFILCPHPSLASLFKYLAWNRDRRAPAVFLTRSSFLKSKPTEAKSGYYLSCVSSRSLSSILPFLLKVYEILHFEKKQRAAGQSEEWVRAGLERVLLRE